MGGRDEDIRNTVENLKLPPLEKGALYHLMGMKTDHSFVFGGLHRDARPGSVEMHNKLLRVLTWGQAFINGETIVGFDAWWADERNGGVGPDRSDGRVHNTSTPERARQTFRATHDLSILPRPTEERKWMVVIGLLALVCAGLAYTYYRRRP